MAAIFTDKQTEMWQGFVCFEEPQHENTGETYRFSGFIFLFSYPKIIFTTNYFLVKDKENVKYKEPDLLPGSVLENIRIKLLLIKDILKEHGFEFWATLFFL